MISTANGHNVLEATVTLPRTGVWHADLIVDTQNAADVTGPIGLSLVDGLRAVRLKLWDEDARRLVGWREAAASFRAAAAHHRRRRVSRLQG